MLALILAFVLLWAALLVLFWAGTVFLQTYIYSEPAEQLFWRAPAAATVLTLFLGFWGYLSYRQPERYDTLFRFNPSEETQYDEFWGETNNQKSLYRRQVIPRGNLPARVEYRDEDSNRIWSRSDAIIVKENDEEVRFEAERDKNQNFKIHPTKGLLYRDKRGRVMRESDVGRVEQFRWGAFFLNLFLNFFLFVCWFAALWLVMRFQWSHALGLAAIFWVVMIVLILPMLLTKVNDTARLTTVGSRQ